jgi:predicted dinucleotide-binding enzyme
VANSRGPETLSELAAETGAVAAPLAEVARGAGLVVVTIPQRSVPLLPAGVFDGVSPDAVIVDTGNYYPRRDGEITAIEAGMTESGWVAAELGRPLVKAFNTIRAADLLERGLPAGSPGRIAIPLAGDDPAAKALVAALIDELGFDPVDAGTLEESWRQQPGSPVYAANLDAEAARAALAAAVPVREPSWRA